METDDNLYETAFQPYQNTESTRGSHAYGNSFSAGQPCRKENVLPIERKSSHNGWKIFSFFAVVTMAGFMVASLLFLVAIKRDVAGRYSARNVSFSSIEKTTTTKETTTVTTTQRTFFVGSDINGWYHASNGYSYKLIYSYKTYKEANKSCAEIGSILASAGVRNNSILREIQFHLPRNYRYQSRWVGLDKLASTKTWRWSDGEMFDQTNVHWEKYQANDPYDLEKCVTVGGYSREPGLRRTWCGDTNQYICEKMRLQNKHE